MREGQTNTDFLIIGGGVIGLSIARELQKRGAARITVVDQGVCGREASWAAAGMLTPQSEADETGPFFDLCCESRDLYPQFAGELFAETGIDIELDRGGTLAVAFNDADVRDLEERHRRQCEGGLDVAHLSREEILNREPNVSPDVKTGLFFSNDWQVENRKLVEALRRYAELNRIELVENTQINSLAFNGNGLTEAMTSSGPINAGVTVLATGAWTSLIKCGDEELPVSIEPVRGQIVVFEPGEQKLSHVVHSPRGYLVPRRDGRVLVGSTSEHVGFDANVTEGALRSLTNAACEMLPFLRGISATDHWSGLRPFAPDGLPVLGAIDGIDDLFVATGHYRNGILLAPLTAKLTADMLIEGQRSRSFDEFSVRRFQARRAGTGN